MAQSSLVDLARAQFDRRPIRYGMVSAVSVVVSQSILLFSLAVLDWRPVVANITTVAVSAIPSYLLNRAWVWERRGGHNLGREVVPFWMMNFLGLGFSTLFVYLASRWTDAPLATSAANLLGFGILWVAKYLFLDAVLFGRPDEHDPAVLL